MQAAHPSPDLDRLFRESAADLTRYFSRRHSDGESPQDLVQQTFLELARGLDKGRRPESMRGYLFGIARHVSLAAWKRRDRDRAFSAETEPELVADPPADDRIDAARELIAAMPPLQREVLELRFSQDLSYAEIAAALNIPVGTVRSRLHHAVAAMRRQLAADESESNPTQPHDH